MSSFFRFRDASDDNQQSGCESDSSRNTAASYDRRGDRADETLREKQARERDSRRDF